MELEVRPLFLVPDTNGFIDHLAGLKKLLQCGIYIIVVPLVGKTTPNMHVLFSLLLVCGVLKKKKICVLSVITELDGLAKGQDNFGGGLSPNVHNTGSAAHFRAVQEKARLAVGFLEKRFEAREPCLRALTSRGNQLESIAFRSEDTSGQQVRTRMWQNINVMNLKMFPGTRASFLFFSFKGKQRRCDFVLLSSLLQRQS